MKLDDEIIHFLCRQHYTVISSVDKDGAVHNSCKGIVNIDQAGHIYLLDLYKQRTYENLKANSNISLTAVDEHKFKGYTLKGKAHIISEDKISPDIMAAWDKKISGRISHRILKNIKGEKGHKSHPEVLLPRPEYIIEMRVDKIVDLTPHALKT
jgi:predicted pyridoxine 5'-phosphate oxidase superfamily flavin-nucleotide-binding protein